MNKCIVTVVVLVLFAGVAQAETLLETSGDWFEPANWSDGVPTATLEAKIGGGLVADIDAAGGEAGRVLIGTDTDGGILNIDDDGVLSVTSPNSPSIHIAAGAHTQGALNLDGGSLTLSHQLHIATDAGSAGVVNLNSGSFSMQTSGNGAVTV